MGLIENMKQGLEYEEKQLKRYQAIARRKTDATLQAKIRKDRKAELYICRGKELSYVNKDTIQEAIKVASKYRAEAAVRLLTQSMEARKRFLSDYNALTEENIDKFVENKAYSSEVLGSRINRWAVNRIKDEKRKLCATPSENKLHCENLTLNTKFGLAVRTRIEVLIAEALYDAGCLFQYEKELKLYDGKGYPVVKYPDFTIFHNDTVTYWEHAGMYGDSEYAARHDEKMHIYFINGIYQPKNLIVTMDGPDCEIDMEDIWRIIKTDILEK